MKQQLKQKLLKYSSLGSAITLIAGQGEAQIVYVDPPDIVINNGAFDIDLNNDGVFDFRFYDLEAGSSEIVYFVGNDYSDQVLDGTHCFGGYWFFPKMIHNGQIIKNNVPGNWNAPTYGVGTFAVFCSASGSCNIDIWEGKNKGFFAFRFKELPAQNNYNYGWMRVSVSANCQGMKIHDWAYNSQQGASIMAGETMRMAESADESGSGLLVHAENNILHIGNNINAEILQVFIYNISGQLLLQTKTSGDATEVDLNAFPSGMLMVYLRGDVTNKTWKVMIQ
jgi:hypothetical protein